MTSIERRDRLHAAMGEKTYLSRAEILSCRKEATMLDGGLNAESYLVRDAGNSLGSGIPDPEDQIMARRRRIYEAEYNRPYPRKRTIQLFADHESVYSMASAVEETSLVSEDEARIPSSRQSQISSQFLSRKDISYESFDLPHDEIVQDTFPDQEWKGTCVAQTATEFDLEERWAESLPSPIQDASPRRRNRSTSRSSPVKAKAIKKHTISSNSSTSTPKTVSTAESSIEDVDPLEDLIVCATPGFLQSAADLAYNLTMGEPQTKNQTMSKPPRKEVTFEYPEFLCDPTTDLNFDFEFSKCPSAEREAPETSAKDFLSTPIRPIVTTETVDISPLSVPCRADCAFFTPSPEPESKTDIDVVDPAIAEGYEESPRNLKDHIINRSLHKFLKYRNARTLNLYIDEYSTALFDRIVENLYGNTTLKTIELCRSRIPVPGSQRTVEEMVCLLEAIRCLPYLKTLVVANFSSFLLPALVENLPTSLVTLNLQVLDQTISDDILDTLISKKNLSNLLLEAQGSMNIGRLVKIGSRIKTIKVLGVTYSMDFMHMQFLADTLYNNIDCRLRLLDLQPIMDVHGWKALTASLRANTQLQTLRVNVLGSTVEEKDDSALELVNLLNVNTTLKSITNYSHDDLIVSGKVLSGPVVDALQANTTLRNLRFFQEDAMFWVAKDAILGRNCEKGELREAFYNPYASLAALLPSVKSRLCGQ